MSLRNHWLALPLAASALLYAAENPAKLNIEGVRLFKAGKYAESIPAFRKALDVASAARDPDVVLLVNINRNLANAYSRTGDHANGVLYGQRSVAICESNSKCKPSLYALALSQSAYANHELYKDDIALPLFERALQLAEKEPGAESEDTAFILVNLGEIYHHLSRFADSEKYFDRALAITSKKLPDSRHYLDVVIRFANFLWTSGDYKHAEDLLQRAIAETAKRDGDDATQLVLPLGTLAGIYRSDGEYWRADDSQARVDAICRKHPDFPPICTFRAFPHPEIEWPERVRRGDYRGAAALLRQIVDDQDRAHGSFPQDKAARNTTVNTLFELADLHESLGEYSTAIELERRILQIEEQAPELSDRAPRTRYQLALDLERAGRTEEAEQVYPEAISSLEAQFEKNMAARVDIWTPNAAVASASLLANYYNRHGNSERAEALLDRASELVRKADGPESLGYANNLIARARNYAFLHRHDRVLPLMERGLAIQEKRLGPDHPFVAATLADLASEALVQKDLAQAKALLARASAIEESNVTLFLGYGTAEDRQLWIQGYVRSLNLALSLHYDFGRDDPAALELAMTELLERKGRALESAEESLRSVRAQANGADQALLNELSQIRSVRATLALKGPPPDDPGTYRARLQQLRQRDDEIEKTLSARYARFQPKSQRVTMAQLRSALPKDGALVEIVLCRPYNTERSAFDSTRFLAYILPSEGPVQTVSLGPAASVDQLVQRFRKALSSPATSDVKEIAREFDRRITGPIRAQLGTAKNVYLSPDGSLNLVPFAAAIDEDGHYLVERYSFTYLSAGRDLLRQPAVSSRNGPMIFADPAYGEGTVSEDLPATRGPRSVDLRLMFDPLPGTAAEAKQIASILPGAKLLSGREASETNLKQVHGPSVLHIATHGFFLKDQPGALGERGVLKTPLETTSPTPEITPQALVHEDPLLRSGLAFACANFPCGGPDDGILTALEASTLDLSGTRLVVLSACDTGVGDIQNGDGVYGLRRAFVLAGAENQIISLWRVDDQATGDLMAEFYRKFAAHSSPSTSLREGQVHLLESGARGHPYYWAAFIVSGRQSDWR